MLKYVIIAARNLTEHKQRSLVLGSAIALVTVTLIVVLGLFAAIDGNLRDSVTTTVGGQLNIQGFFKTKGGRVIAVTPRVTEILAALQDIPEIAYVTSRGHAVGKVVSDADSAVVAVTGIDIRTEPGLRRVLHLSQGSFDALKDPNTALLFDDQAALLGVALGDRVTFAVEDDRGVSNTADVTVVAIARSLGLLSAHYVFANAQTVRELIRYKDDSTGALLLYLKDERNVVPAEKKVRRALERAGIALLARDPRSFWIKLETAPNEAWIGQRWDISTWYDEATVVSWPMGMLHALGSSLIFVLILVVSAGVTSALWIAIRERTPEIGTLRALGMQRWQVAYMFLNEAFLLGLAATSVGALLGAGVCGAINALRLQVPTGTQYFIMSDSLSCALDLGIVLTSMTVIVGAMTVVSIFPSFLAARLKPVTAIASIG